MKESVTIENTTKENMRIENTRKENVMQENMTVDKRTQDKINNIVNESAIVLNDRKTVVSSNITNETNMIIDKP